MSLRLTWVEPTAMFVAVWMIYAADRLLDARALHGPRNEMKPDRDSLEERHRFHHEHRRGFLAGLTIGAWMLAYLLHRLAERELRLYALLATLLGLWMLLIHVRVDDDRRLPKEIAVGLFFAAAVFIPTAGRLPSFPVSLLPAALLFAGVCTLNCLLLYAWEHPGRPAQAHWITRLAVRHLNALAVVLILGSAIVAALPRGRVGLVCGLSVMLLWALHHGRGFFTAIHLRALADLMLLTPLLWMLR